MVSIFSGCGTDTQLGPTSTDSGAGGRSGTGGRRATGGSSTSTGGGAGAGGGGGATCSVSFGTTCDGIEDCPAGQRCCGRLDPGGQPIRYIEIGCMPSCAAPAGDSGPMGTPDLFEVCHPTDTCENSTATCLTSQYLPAGLNRCLPSGVMSTGNPPDPTLDNVKNEVNCGSKVCTADEQCCVRMPLEPYCAPRNATCACSGPPDAGTPGDGGRPDGSTTPDAAPTSDASDGATGD
jgi:hypothetical protein